MQQNRDNSDLNNFVDSISVPILMLTNDLRIRRFTPAAQRLFKFIPTDVGRPFSDLRTNFDVPNLESIILEVLETLNTKEEEVQTQAGYWYALRIRPYRTTENQIDGVTMVFLDIDALKGHAAQLELARNYAEAIVETVQIPLVVLNTEMRVNTANQSFYETFQVSLAETSQLSFFELGNKQWNLPQLRSLLEEILVNDGQLHNFEIEHVFERIGQKTMLINACKLRQEDNAAMILLSIEDITEHQQLEAKRQLLIQEQSARQLAETANRAKDEFLSNLSHELRNPLNTMLGWSKLLRTRTLNEEKVTQALEAIERSAKAQNQLIEDILDISRIMNGKLRLNIRPLDLRLSVQAAIDIIQLSAEAKNIQIVSSLNSVTMVGDADRLQQVLWNLLSNAIKFTPLNGRIEITLESVQRQAQIRITDTGQGISADLLPYIFDRFRQGDSSTTKAKAGLGLGLSIVRHLVELHGGTIGAQSPGEGQGATFTVKLPLRDLPQLTSSSDLEPTAFAASMNDLSQAVPSLSGLRVLAVDDEIDTCELYKSVLENYGAQVLTVASARLALSALNQAPNRYNVLICDIGMPEEDGYWLIQQVRSLSAQAGGQIPAVALTAYASEAQRQLAIKAGFQMHIAKPVEPVQLALLVAHLAGRA
nr:ATP-binding protein [Komarekiella delphini-convector]